MPPFAPLASTSAGLVSALAGTGPQNTSVASTALGGSSSSLQVVCAWPISGQYGPGSRALYYILVATCVLARKARWLRDACIAAALLLPAVAALHGIVLAVMHVDGAVDLDVYGAFQLSSIAILAAPVTLRRSTTYFDGPGRNIIFVWTGILLAGMLSLAVELWRSKSVRCAAESINAANFTYDTSASSLCDVRCSQNDGPSSPMRKGATGEIYVIPTPTLLRFGTATLLAAGCCIISILSLVDIFNKIRHDNRKRHNEMRNAMNGHDDTNAGRDDADKDEVEVTISGTNGATQSMMENAERRAKFLMGAVEIPLFTGAIIAILVMGERNFLSPELSHGTEPMANIGQWAPIVTAALAAIGSLYLLGEKDLRKYREKTKSIRKPSVETYRTRLPSSATCTRCQGLPDSLSDDRPDSAAARSDDGTEPPAGSRDKINAMLSRVADALGTPTPPVSFRQGPAAAFPETPGEPLKNPKFREDKSKYDDISRERSRSRAPSVRSVVLDEAEEIPASPKTTTSPPLQIAEDSSLVRPPRGPRRDDSLIPLLKIREPSRSRSRPRGDTYPASNRAASSSTSATERGRRHTLEVPSPAQLRPSSSANLSSTKTHHDLTLVSPLLHSSPPSSTTACYAEPSSMPSKPSPTYKPETKPK